MTNVKHEVTGAVVEYYLASEEVWSTEVDENGGAFTYSYVEALDRFTNAQVRIMELGKKLVEEGKP